jgi:GT2 family glycosyltransferase
MRALEGTMAVNGERTVLRSCVLLLRWVRAGQLGGHLRAWWRLRRAARRLRASPAFDAKWYLAAYPDVAATGVDPALHYLRRGAEEGRAPLPIANPTLPRLALTDVNYRAWIAAHETPRFAVMRAATDCLAWRPMVGVVVFGGDRDAEAMTLRSLEAQAYPDWCRTDVPCGDVVLFLPAGTRVATTALFRIAAAVAATPSIELVYADEDRIDPEGQRSNPWFKPQWDPVLAAECDLAGVTGAYRRRLLDRLGVGRVRDCAELREVVQSAVTAVSPDAIEHIPTVLFHRPSVPGRWCADGSFGLGDEGERAVHDPSPLVTVVVPTRDRAALLARCVDGLLHRTDYACIELLIIDNDSHELRTTRLLARLTTDPRVRVMAFPGPFNWSAMNNAAVRQARGEIIVLLNNDIDVIDPSWLREMVTLAQRPDIGIVGARLLYPDGTLQHAGITIGPGCVTGHLYRGAARNDPGHGGMLRHTRSVAAVTGACMAMRRTVFETVGGCETEHLAITGNDLDLCLRVRAHGWRVVCTPRAELYHAEAASRGPDVRQAQLERARQERAYLVQRWGALAEHDPYLSPNLATVNEQPVLAAPAASPGEIVAGERCRDALDVGQHIGWQSAGRERGAANIHRVR